MLLRNWKPLILIILIILGICLALATLPWQHRRLEVPLDYMLRSYGSYEPFSQERFLIVQGEWGMCNRLRSYNVAYDLALHTNRELIIINDAKHYEKFWNGDWTKLFHPPPHARFETLMFLEGIGDKNLHQMGKPQDDCGIALSLKDLRAAANKDHVFLRTCEVIVDDMDVTNRFYKQLKPTQDVLDAVAKTLAFIKKEACIGVHIRQGNIPDYEQGYFFGKWQKKEGDQNEPVMCCFDDKSRNVSPCPAAAPGVERFVEAMRSQPRHAKFFVCSDRPGCLVLLEAAFPKRVFYTSSKIEYETDFVRGFCDWYCLGHCSKLLLSAPSSFSVEAAKLNDVPCEYIDVDDGDGDGDGDD